MKIGIANHQTENSVGNTLIDLDKNIYEQIADLIGEHVKTKLADNEEVHLVFISEMTDLDYFKMLPMLEVVYGKLKQDSQFYNPRLSRIVNSWITSNSPSQYAGITSNYASDGWVDNKDQDTLTINFVLRLDPNSNEYLVEGTVNLTIHTDKTTDVDGEVNIRGSLFCIPVGIALVPTTSV